MTTEAIDYSKVDNKSTNNQWANYWRYHVGVNVIPAVGPAKVPIKGCYWSDYQDESIPEWQHQEWLKNNSFKDGMAVIHGKVWHRPDLEGYYFFGIDCDNIIAINEFLTSSNGKQMTIEDLAQKTIVEQHLDNKTKMHFYGYSNGPIQLRNKTSDSNKPNMDVNTMPAFEVKATSDFIMYCCPCIHKGGHKYQVIGTLSPFTLNQDAIVELQEKIDAICDKYDLNKGNNKIPIRELFKEDTVIYEGHNRHVELLRVMESLLARNNGILSQDQIIDLSQEWNEDHCNPPLDEYEFDKQWNCATGFISKNAIQDSQDQPQQRKVTSKDIKFVFDTIKKEAPYDEISIKQIFYGSASAFTKIPIHHNVNSIKSGAGKTYVLILVTGYYPNRYVLSFAGMSDKALVHEQGVLVMVDEDTGNTIFVDPIINEIKLKIDELDSQYDNSELKRPEKKEIKKQIKRHEDEIKELYKKAEKLILLDNRIILLLDTAQEGFYETLMSMISQDTPRDQLYQFTDKLGSGKLGATKNRLRGTPAIFTTQVVDDTRQARYQEKNRRFIHVTPDTSSDKIKSAMNLMGQRYGLLPEEYDQQVVSRDDKELARDIISTIVDKLIDHSKLFKPKESGVRIPFYESISHGLRVDPNDTWSMTVMDRTIRYLSTITKVNMDSRAKIKNTETGQIYPISTFEDLQETLQLMGMASSTLRPYIANWYNKVFLPTFKGLNDNPNELKSKNGYIVASEIHVGLSTPQLAEATREIMHVSKPSSDSLLKSYLYPLLNLGYMDKIQSNIDRRSYIYFPVKEGNISSTFENEEDLRLKIINSMSYPSRNVIENSFRTFNFYYHRGGVEKNKKYLLLDHDGNEISISELIDKYLSNPEICFIDNTNQQKVMRPTTTINNAYISTIQKNIFFTPPSCGNILKESYNNVKEDSSSDEANKSISIDTNVNKIEESSTKQLTTVVHVRDGYDVYIGRDHRDHLSEGWGNPFKISDGLDREQAIELYKDYFINNMIDNEYFRTGIENLRGKRLGCFCKPKACHGDIIAEYLNTGLMPELKSIQTPQVQAKAITKNNSSIYNSYRDIWACYQCKVTGDRFAMEDHNCSRSLKK